MRALIIVTAIVLIVGAFGLVSLPQATASNAIAETEGIACTSCHDKPGSKLLTDQGKYYELMSSLDGYEEITAAFSECTTCHVRKPGSNKLTKKGKQFQWMLTDMEGLKALVLGHHPSAGDGTELEGSDPTESRP